MEPNSVIQLLGYREQLGISQVPGQRSQNYTSSVKGTIIFGNLIVILKREARMISATSDLQLTPLCHPPRPCIVENTHRSRFSLTAARNT